MIPPVQCKQCFCEEFNDIASISHPRKRVRIQHLLLHPNSSICIPQVPTSSYYKRSHCSQCKHPIHPFYFSQSAKIKGPCAYPQGVSAVLFHCCLGSIFSPVVHFPQSTRPPSITTIVTCNYHHHLLPQLTQFVSSSPSSTTLSPPHT